MKVEEFNIFVCCGDAGHCQFLNGQRRLSREINEIDK